MGEGTLLYAPSVILGFLLPWGEGQDEGRNLRAWQDQVTGNSRRCPRIIHSGKTCPRRQHGGLCIELENLRGNRRLALLAGEGAGLAAIFAGARIVLEVVFIHPNHIALAMGSRLGLARVARQALPAWPVSSLQRWTFPQFSPWSRPSRGLEAFPPSAPSRPAPPAPGYSQLQTALGAARCWHSCEPP